MNVFSKFDEIPSMIFQDIKETNVTDTLSDGRENSIQNTIQNIKFSRNPPTSRIVKQNHTVYPVTPNAGMFYQRGYKHLRRGNTQGKKTCNHAFPLFLFLILLFRLYVKEPF